MGLDVRAFNAAAYSECEKGFVQLSKDGKSLETVGTGRLGSIAVKFLSPDPRHRQTREALFSAVRASLADCPSASVIQNFMKEVAAKLDLPIDARGALAKGAAAAEGADKPLSRRTVRQVLKMVTDARLAGQLDPTWKRVVHNNVSTFQWTHEKLATRLDQDGWLRDDKLRELVVKAMLDNTASLRAQAEKKPLESEKKPLESEKKPVEAAPKSVEAEKLPEGFTDLAPVKFKFIGGNLGERGGNTTIEPSMTGIVKSVKDNPAGGHCFFYSALEQIKECKYPLDECNAGELREKLANHGKDLVAKARAGKLGEHALRLDMEGLWTVPTTKGRVNVGPAIEQLDKEADFEKGKAWAEFQQGAFLADLLKRPVTIVASSIPDGHKITFDRDLTNGKKLAGDPIVIYYTHADRHFRAAEL